MQQTTNQAAEDFHRQLKTLKQEIQRLEQKTGGNPRTDNLPIYKKVRMVGDAVGLGEEDYTNSSNKYYQRPNAEGWDKIFKWFRGNVEKFDH